MDKILIADIGAANFKIGERWLFLKHEIDVILFEPDERSFKELNSKGIKAHNVALGADETNKTFYCTRKPECSSFLKPNIKYLKKFPDSNRWDIIKEKQIQTKRLDDININDIDFLKIDTQGSELDILHGAKEKILPLCLGIEIEVSFLEIYENQPLFGDILAFLKEHDFEFYDFVTEYRYGRKQLNRKGQLAFADALFLRTPEYVNTHYSKFNDKKSKFITISKAYNKEDLGQCIE